jgi:hypothetical protein
VLNFQNANSILKLKVFHGVQVGAASQNQHPAQPQQLLQHSPIEKPIYCKSLNRFINILNIPGRLLDQQQLLQPWIFAFSIVLRAQAASDDPNTINNRMNTNKTTGLANAVKTHRFLSFIGKNVIVVLLPTCFCAISGLQF